MGIRLDVPVFRQREAECGNTSLKAVCWYHGRRYSARRLGALAGITPDGIDHDRMVAAAEATGATVLARAGGSIAELRRFLADGLPVIVGWWSMGRGDAPFDPTWNLDQRRARDCGHYSVVRGLDARRILLMDPVRSARRAWEIGAFEELWYDTDGAAYERVDRWFMVVRY